MTTPDTGTVPETQTMPTEELSIEGLRGRTTLVLGAPYIGKTEQFKRFDTELADVSRCENLRSVEAVNSDVFVIIDDFYDAFLRATPAERESLPELLQRDGGICLSTRPRSLDWLLEQGAEYPFDEGTLSQIEQLVLLTYDRNEDVGNIVSACQRIDEGFDGFALSQEFDQLEYPGYSFDNDALSTAVETYGPTIVPWLVSHFSISGGGTGRFLSVQEGIDAVREFGENFSLSHLIGDVRETASDLLSTETVQFTGLSLMGTVPVAGAGALALWLLLRDNEVPAGEVFDRILEDELNPLAEERIEATLDLPPRTLANLRTLARDGNLHRLEQICGEFPELRADIDQQLSNHAEALNELDKSLSLLEERVDEVTAHTALVSESVSRAVSDTKALQERVCDDESRILQTEIDDVSRILEQYVGDEPAEIVEAVERNDVILLRGPHGTGKTTAGLQACRTLLDRGYDVRLPHFDQESISFVRHGLKATQTQPIVFTSYRVGAGPIRDPARLKNLLEWVQTDICGTVIIECREDFYDDLFDAKRSIGLWPELDVLWSDRIEVEFEPFEGDDGGEQSATLRPLANWVLDELEYEGDRDALIDRAIELADGNPEIVKIATRSGIIDDRTLTDVETAHDLIWRDVEPLFGEDVITIEGVPVGRTVFAPLCALRKTTTEELLAVTSPEVDGGHLAQSIGPLSGYLRGDVANISAGDFTQPLSGDETWEVSPDIYAEVIFREMAIHNDEFTTYLSRSRHSGTLSSFLKLSLSLVLVNSSAGNRDHSDIRAPIEKASNMLLQDLQEGLAEGDFDDSLGDEVFFIVFRTFVIGEVPLDPTIIQEGAARLANGVAIEEDRRGLPSETILSNLFGLLGACHLDSKSQESATRVFEVTQAVLDQHTPAFLKDPHEFNVHVLANTILRLSEARGWDAVTETTELVLAATPEQYIADLPVESDQEFRELVLTALIAGIENRRDQKDISPIVTQLFELMSPSVDESAAIAFQRSNAVSKVISTTATRPVIERDVDEIINWLELVIESAQDSINQPFNEIRFFEVIFGRGLGGLIGESIMQYRASGASLNTEVWIEAMLVAALEREPEGPDGMIYTVNICVEAIGLVSNVASVDEADTWIDSIIETVCEYREFESERAKGALVANLYATALKRHYIDGEISWSETRGTTTIQSTAPFDTADRAQFRSWYDYIAGRIVSEAASAYHSLEFLYNSFGGAVAKIAEDTTVSEAGGCVDRATETARSELAEAADVDVDPDTLHKYIYITATQLIEGKDNAGEDWIAHVASRAAATQPEHGRLKEVVVESIRSLSQAPGPDAPLIKVIIEETVKGLSTSDLGDVYVELIELADSNSRPAAAAAWCVIDFHQRTLPNSNGENLTEDWIEEYVTVLAAAIDLIWLRADFSHPEFERLTSDVEQLSEIDDGLMQEVAATVATELEETHENFIAALDWRETFDLV
ncbi:hypothetical protein [Natrinema longum]|uniref:hypothetical protein n=1 Tax=Natrinema longum TaxID=370324 RepID=UPI001CCF6F65|nr:hypothetical protein [Natrinema longum]MBZ6497169.1 hypothetical protein [Natrinema longum]